MKIEWLVTKVTAVKSPDRAERAIFCVILAGSFLANSCHLCGPGATLCCSTCGQGATCDVPYEPLLEPQLLY